MNAQQMYDRREALAEISGMDLHELFLALTGEMSPAGRTPISREKVEALAALCREQGLQDKAMFLEAFL